jgi:hypothetical protein
MPYSSSRSSNSRENSLQRAPNHNPIAPNSRYTLPYNNEPVTNPNLLRLYNNAYLRSKNLHSKLYAARNKQANVPNEFLSRHSFTMSPYAGRRRTQSNSNRSSNYATIFARFGTLLEAEWQDKLHTELKGEHINETKLEKMKEKFMNKRAKELEEEAEARLKTLQYEPSEDLEEAEASLNPLRYEPSEHLEEPTHTAPTPVQKCTKFSCSIMGGSKRKHSTRRRKRSQSKLNYSKRRNIVLNNKR